MHKYIRLFGISAILLMLFSTICGCNMNNNDADTTCIRIISTSDLHGKMLAYNYLLNQPDASGSLAQVSSAIAEYRNENTILVDVGDTIQDNFADIFNEEGIHPMVQGINAIGYDICTTGNHEYNFGMDVVKKYINTCDCEFLLGNVYNSDDKLLASPYTIIERDGIRIAFIGMTSPNITNWDKDNLEGYTVTDPADETNKIIDSIEEEVNRGTLQPVDAYVGVFHLMDEDEYNTAHSGYVSVAAACPRLNLILGSHGHVLVNDTLDNGIAVTENLDSGKTIQIADITFEKDTKQNTNHITDISTKYIETKDYPEDDKLVALLSPYDLQAKEYANSTIATLHGGPLVQDSEINGINSMLLEDTPMQSLIQHVMLDYAEADVAISSPCTNDDNVSEGDISVADACRMYKYSNYLYTVKMSGAQLKKCLEYSASFYKQYEDGDLIIAFEDTPVYMYDTATGVNYDIDISEPVGNRIKSLSYPDGRMLNDTDELIVAINDYRYNTAISTPGVIYAEDEIPALIERDIRSDVGNIRAMIIDYLKNSMNGTIENECDNNWRIIGTNWDPELHKQAVALINDGTLKLTEGEKYNPCVKKITINDLPDNTNMNTKDN